VTHRSSEISHICVCQFCIRLAWVWGHFPLLRVHLNPIQVLSVYLYKLDSTWNLTSLWNFTLWVWMRLSLSWPSQMQLSLSCTLFADKPQLYSIGSASSSRWTVVAHSREDRQRRSAHALLGIRRPRFQVFHGGYALIYINASTPSHHRKEVILDKSTIKVSKVLPLIILKYPVYEYTGHTDRL
jgi:hypothetical protein